MNFVFSNVSVDQNWKMNFISFFEFFENCDRNNKRSLIYFFEKNDDGTMAAAFKSLKMCKL